MLTAVALSVGTCDRAVTASDAATTICEPSVEAVRALLVEPAGELEQNGFAAKATVQLGLVAFTAAREVRPR
jgi:hypothetical protein